MPRRRPPNPDKETTPEDDGFESFPVVSHPALEIMRTRLTHVHKKILTRYYRLQSNDLPVTAFGMGFVPSWRNEIGGLVRMKILTKHRKNEGRALVRPLYYRLTELGEQIVAVIAHYDTPMIEFHLNPYIANSPLAKDVPIDIKISE